MNKEVINQKCHPVRNRQQELTQLSKYKGKYFMQHPFSLGTAKTGF